MSRIDEVRAQVAQVDLVVMAMVEMLRGFQEPHEASPITVAANIKKAPPREVATVMLKLEGLGLLERKERHEGPRGFKTFQLTPLGVELMLADVGNWNPARREQERRDRDFLAAVAGGFA